MYGYYICECLLYVLGRCLYLFMFIPGAFVCLASNVYISFGLFCFELSYFKTSLIVLRAATATVAIQFDMHLPFSILKLNC